MINIEIKARCSEPDRIKAILGKKGAVCETYRQIDTYFNVFCKGARLKLREEFSQNRSDAYLIYYTRENINTPKKSDVIMYKTSPDSELKKILTDAMGFLVQVVKERKVYRIENVKIHIDVVQGLTGNFVEVECIDEHNSIGEARLHEQCTFYLKLFQIDEADLISGSYSDLLLESRGLAEAC